MGDFAIVKNIIGGKKIVVRRLYGGDINRVYKVTSDQNTFVVKLNEAKKFPLMFEREAEGLKALSIPKGLKTPAIIKFGQLEDTQYLVLEYLKSGYESSLFWSAFGFGLVAQHQTSHKQFGFDNDNYIGALHQSNNRWDKWDEFLITERFIPQLKRATDEGIIDSKERQKIEAIFLECKSLWPEEPPALLHGDLWSGNYLIGTFGKPYLIDPAVYFGHREMDIGMMHLFGGFDKALFEYYDNKFPLEKNWEDRVKYNQLYPLLVHLNLFGRGYLDKILQIVRPFS